jgi:hypothetical protein
MLIWIVILVVTVVALYLIGLAVGFGAYGAAQRARVTEAQYDASEPVDLDLIPQIMRDFALRNGGTVGGPPVFEAIQQAELRTGPKAPFFPLRARQTLGTRAPAIAWMAKGIMPPGIPVSGLDCYVAGAGDFEIRLFGTIPVATASDAAAAVGELMRYLSELPIYPDAILNCTGLSWHQLNDRQVEVTAQSNFGPASVTFSFDDAGDIVGLTAERPRDTGHHQSVLTPWLGRYSDYRSFGAYRLPVHGEVGWQLPNGYFVYWRGDLVSLEAGA